MKSIKTKLIVSFSVIILIATIIIGFISLDNGYRSLKQEAERSLQVLATEGAKLTENRMNSLISILKVIAMRREVIDMGWEVDISILTEELGKTDFLDIGFVLPNGYTYYADGTVRLMSDRVYIKSALDGQAMISDVIISRVSSKPEVEVSVPVMKDGEVVGALVGRKEADALSNFIHDIAYGKKGYANIINGNGIVIADKDVTKVMERYNPINEYEEQSSRSSIANAYHNILEMKTGVTSYEDGQGYLYAGFAPINGTDWIFVITAAKEEVLEGIPAMVRNIIVAMIVILIVSIVFVFLLDNSLTRPLITMIKQSERIANFDVSVTIADTYLTQKDEIGILSRAFQKTTDKLREIIKELTDSIHYVSATAQELTATSLQSSMVMEGIAKTVTNIEHSAKNQADSTKAGLQQASLLEDMIERNQKHLLNLNKTSNQVTNEVLEGLQEIEQLNLITEINDEATKEIGEVILKTEKSSKEISEASKVIAAIAKQTNMLSLNASIEASRAGEAGKGFAVVAKEILILAKQSADSSKYIDEIIMELQGNVKKAVEHMSKIEITSEKQKNSVINTVHKYEVISKAMQASEVVVEELNLSETNMVSVKDKIKNMLESLALIAENNAEGTQQASLAMHEQTVFAREIAGASDKLSSLAINLQELVSKFRAN